MSALLRKLHLLLVLNLIKYIIKENKELKIEKILRKSQPNLQRYVKKIEAQAKKWFSYERKTCSLSLISKLHS